jgi:hypothetical protein
LDSPSTAGFDGTRTRIGIACSGLLVVVSLWFLGSCFAMMPLRLFSGWTNTIMEAQPVYGTQRMVSGIPLYGDWHRTAIPLTYGPLEYAVPAAICQLAAAKDAPRALLTGRLQSLAGAVVLGAGMIGLFALRTRRGPHALAVVLPLFWFPYLSEWMTNFAPDLAAAGLSLLGWYLLERGNVAARGRLRRLLVGAAVLSWTAGLFYKPTLVPGIVGYLCTNVPGRDASRHKWFGYMMPVAATLVLTISAAVLLQQRTHSLFLEHLFGSQKLCRYSPVYAWEGLQQIRLPGILLLALIVVWCAVRFVIDPLARAIVLSFLLECALMGKQGSNAHYLYGTVALSSLFAAVQVFAVVTGRASGRAAWLTSAACVTTALLLLANWRAARVLLWEGVIPLREEIAYVNSRVSTRGEALALEPYYGMVNRVPYAFADSYHASLLESRGRAEFKQQLLQQRYQCVVANASWLDPARYQDQLVVPAETQAALLQTYDMEFRGRWLVLFRLRSSSARRSN